MAVVSRTLAEVHISALQRRRVNQQCRSRTFIEFGTINYRFDIIFNKDLDEGQILASLKGALVVCVRSTSSPHIYHVSLHCTEWKHAVSFLLISINIYAYHT